MQQGPYFYPGDTEIPSGSNTLQYQNPYPTQPTLNTWPTNLNPDLVSPTGLYNRHQPQVLTPVSTAMYGTTSTYSWAHTVPSLMPWVPSAEATVPDPVVRFSAPFLPPDPCTSQTATSWELLHNLGANKQPNPNLHLKRKGDADILETTPQKLCITEEKMAARFREMHISNQYRVPVGEKSLETITNSMSSRSVNKSVTNLQQLEIILNDSDSSEFNTKSLILAPELKKLVEPEKILSTFLNKIEQPSMALVVWQPPSNKLLTDKKNKEDGGSSSVPVMENNNNMTPEQLNAMCQQYLASHVHQQDQAQDMSEDSMDI